MAKLIWSAFSDEYSQDLVEQCKALNGFGIGYMEARGVNGKNISTLTKAEVADMKKTLDDYQRYINLEIDRGVRRGGSGYGNLTIIDKMGNLIV